jgi:hypothetical protein
MRYPPLSVNSLATHSKLSEAISWLNERPQVITALAKRRRQILELGSGQQFGGKIEPTAKGQRISGVTFSEWREPGRRRLRPEASRQDEPFSGRWAAAK